MRCRACNNEMEVVWFMPEVEDDVEPVGPLLETCCPKCLLAADPYGDGDDELDELLDMVVPHGHSHSSE